MAPNILAAGEILWDLLPSGKQLGGAPANFAYHAHELGAEVRIVSRVGTDPLGREILDRLRALELPIDGVGLDPSAPTGTVSVELGADGQPAFTIYENVAWDEIETDPASLEFAARAEVVCFGSLAQRREASRLAIRTLVAQTPPAALRVFDINLRQHFHSREVIETSLELTNVLKLNDGELPALATEFDLAGDVREQMTVLARRFDLRAVALTRGSHGSLLLADGRWSDHPGLPTKIVDTVGAGDAFTAAMTIGLLIGWELDRINQRANEVAAFVCSQHGATPPLPESILAAFRDDGVA